jgi:hypothetical protein
MYVITQINTYYMRLTTNENGYDNYWWGDGGNSLGNTMAVSRIFSKPK